MGRLIFLVFYLVLVSGAGYAEDIPDDITDAVVLGAGAGLYVNTLNFSAGPMVYLWPLDDFGFQAIYGIGAFTTYEARFLYRANVSQDQNFYIGTGYLHVEKEASVGGVNTTVSGDGVNFYAGMERALFKMDPRMNKTRKLFFYLEFSRPYIDISKEVETPAGRKKATVDYRPFSIGTGIAYYLF